MHISMYITYKYPLYIYRKVYCKELMDMIVEADKFKVCSTDVSVGV